MSTVDDVPEEWVRPSVVLDLVVTLVVRALILFNPRTFFNVLFMLIEPFAIAKATESVRRKLPPEKVLFPSPWEALYVLKNDSRFWRVELLRRVTLVPSSAVIV